MMVLHIGTITEFASMNVDAFIDGERRPSSKASEPMSCEEAADEQTAGQQSRSSAISHCPFGAAATLGDRDILRCRDRSNAGFLLRFPVCLERRGGDNSTERFDAFFADSLSADAERDAFAQAWDYLSARPTAIVYYYSKYERTIWRGLQQKYPDVCTSDEIEPVQSCTVC